MAFVVVEAVRHRGQARARPGASESLPGHLSGYGAEGRRSYTTS